MFGRSRGHKSYQEILADKEAKRMAKKAGRYKMLDFSIDEIAGTIASKNSVPYPLYGAQMRIEVPGLAGHHGRAYLYVKCANGTEIMNVIWLKNGGWVESQARRQILEFNNKYRLPSNQLRYSPS